MIRYAKKNDYEHIEQLMKQAHQLHIQLRPDIYREILYIFSKEVYETYIENQQILVFEKENHIVGMLLYMIKEAHTPMHQKRKVLYIDTLVVDEKYHRQGIGQQLIDEAKHIAIKKECQSLELPVNSFNENALKMYEHYGFHEKTTTMEYLFTNKGD